MAKILDMEIGRQEASFFDADALTAQPRPLFRIDSGRGRFYYTLDETEKPTFYVSVTSLIDQTLPKSPFLIQWMVEQQGNGDAYRDEKMHYGTLFHILVEKMMIEKALPIGWRYIQMEIGMYCAREEINVDQDKWTGKLQSDLLAVAQWYKDCDVKPLAIEVMLASEELGVAGAIDLVCELTTKVYETRLIDDPKSKFNGQVKQVQVQKRVLAIVDFKSGGLYDSHAAQLEIYRQLWNEAYPDKEVKHIFNLRPKDWQTEPGYEFKEQTRHKLVAAVPHLLELYKIIGAKAPSDQKVIDGLVVLGNDLSEYVTVMTMEQIIQARRSELIDEGAIEVDEDADMSGLNAIRVMAGLEPLSVDNVVDMARDRGLFE